jgi:hypothetical protein
MKPLPLACLLLLAGGVLSGCRPATYDPPPPTPTTQAEADYYKSDPAKLAAEKKNAIPWDGKGVDPNFPLK